MKKIFSILLVVMLLASLTVTAFADNFVNSAVNAGAPEVKDVVDADGNDVASGIEITPVTGAEELDEEAQKEMEDAYESLKDVENLADINEDLKEAAGDNSIVVSDLFNISAKEEVSFPLKLTLKNQNLDNFAALLQYVDGEWNWIDAEVNGDELSFEVDSLGTFAIIVFGEPATSAQTGESSPVFFLVGAVVLAGAAAWFFMKSRKVEA